MHRIDYSGEIPRHNVKPSKRPILSPLGVPYGNGPGQVPRPVERGTPPPVGMRHKDQRA